MRPLDRRYLLNLCLLPSLPSLKNRVPSSPLPWIVLPTLPVQNSVLFAFSLPLPARFTLQDDLARECPFPFLSLSLFPYLTVTKECPYSAVTRQHSFLPSFLPLFASQHSVPFSLPVLPYNTVSLSPSQHSVPFSTTQCPFLPFLRKRKAHPIRRCAVGHRSREIECSR